mmetsp:Transcript_49539/g.115913  ORF Transcript_49539/g.115913 Transcript_49539/m.115913 type:complete len:1521 (-) Transcript_49539:155-4717(-)
MHEGVDSELHATRGSTTCIRPSRDDDQVKAKAASDVPAPLDVREQQVSLPAVETDVSVQSPNPAWQNPAYIHTWTVEDVAKWLSGNGLLECADAFRENRISGDLLLDIDKDDLMEMDIKAIGDRKRVMNLIEQLRYDSKQATESGLTTLDFLFLGASPLVQKTKDGVQPLELIDLEAEQAAIHKAIMDSNRQCRFKHEFATLRELSIGIFNRSCKVLFLSGHTLPSGHWLLESTGSGEAMAYNPKDLFQHDETSTYMQELSQPPASPSAGSRVPGNSLMKVPSSDVGLKLVVLSSCHSSQTASLFIEAGVPHVIAVERSETVLDVSARIFAQSLCHSLLLGNTVSSAFKHAQWLVRNNEYLSNERHRATAKQEAQKFVLLPRGANHHVVLFPAIMRGQPVDCSTPRPAVQFPRTRLDLTSLRQVEVWQALTALHKHRFVQVLGPPGVGKRTLVCLTAHYLWQRQQTFKDGIHYIHVDDFRWVVAVDWYLRRMVATGGHANSSMPLDDDGEPSRFGEALSPAAAGHSADQLAHESFLAQGLSLPGQRLLVLDGCHGLYQKCRENFVVWLSRLLSDNPGLQVLATAQSRIDVPADIGRLGCNAVPATDAIVEVGELSDEDAIRLLKWRCHVLPEAAVFLEEHGARLVKMCGKLPFALCVCARWLMTQLPREDPQRLVEMLEDEQQHLGVFRPCRVVYDTALAVLPPFLHDHLRQLSVLRAGFSADVAAAVWGIEVEEAAQHIGKLCESYLLERVQDQAEDQLNAVVAQSLTPLDAAQSCKGTLFRLQPLLRLHLKDQLLSTCESTAASCGISPESCGRLVACYVTRLCSGLVHREEFPNVQFLLDLTGVTCSFLLLLWACRKNRWAHNWLGDGRRAHLYERAIAVLTAIESSRSGSLSEERSKAVADAPQVWPSDFVSVEGGNVGVDRTAVEAVLRRMLQPFAQGYHAGTRWGDVQGFLFMLGSPMLPSEVFGDALTDELKPLIQIFGPMDQKVQEVLGTSVSELSAMAASLADEGTQDSHCRFLCEALVELAKSLRSSDMQRSLKLSYVASALVARQHFRTHQLDARSQGLALKDIDENLRPVLIAALVEFVVTLLAVRGDAAQPLTTCIIHIAVCSKLQSEPMSEETLSLLHLAAMHALVIECRPQQAERFMKRCLELQLRKHNHLWQHKGVVETLQDCGLLCHGLGDFGHAESMLKTAASLWQEVKDIGVSRKVEACIDLANLLTSVDKVGDAENYYLMALQWSKTETPSLMLQTLNHLACLYIRCGRFSAAEPLLRDCLQGVEHAEGSQHRLSVAAVRHNLATSLMRASKDSPEKKKVCVAEAYDLLTRVCEAHASLLPATHASALAARQKLAACQQMLDMPSEARQSLIRVKQSMEHSGEFSAQEIDAIQHEIASMEADLVSKGDTDQVQQLCEQPQVRSDVILPGSAADSCGFYDVDGRDMSLFQRLTHVLDKRVKAVLGVAPPAALSCGGRSRVVLAKGDEYDALECQQPAASLTSALSLATVISQMELECQRMA